MTQPSRVPCKRCRTGSELLNMHATSGMQAEEGFPGKDSSRSPAWKTDEHLSWFIEDRMPAKYYQDERDPLSFGLASLGPPIDIHREWWASFWVGGNAWMLDQLRQSPLRAVRREDADIIILPVLFRAGSPTDENQVRSGSMPPSSQKTSGICCDLWWARF